MTGLDSRYALYWAPRHGSRLAEFGARWLGRDAEATRLIEPFLEGDDLALVAEPARYGLHATMKPPFALAEGASLASLEQALTGFAAARAPFTLGQLELTDLKGFLALCTPSRVLDLHALADACVREFDRFRRPPTEAELTKRRAAKLTSAQDAHLLAWGYPYVFDQFRFHVTLTQRLGGSDASRIRSDLAERLVNVLQEEHWVEDIALFEEPSRGAPFSLRRRFKLG